ncbi:MAG TPA: hypothetical protein VJ761_12510 [Ktedonobacteraceae bacterium]|nr:hypothetical protein [Ktedonobacteraceae bacterium]
MLVYQEHAAISSPLDDPFTSALEDAMLVSLPHHSHSGPDPRWKIPPSEWGTVLQRVEQGEPLRRIARDYGVSYEAVRRMPIEALEQGTLPRFELKAKRIDDRRPRT